MQQTEELPAATEAGDLPGEDESVLEEPVSAEAAAPEAEEPQATDSGEPSASDETPADEPVPAE